jgi:aldehyde:ferredoxin oxidoreductase
MIPPHPFTGKILWVDLTRGVFTEEILPESIYQKVLAGLGLAAYILYRDLPPGADPLGAENILGFIPGLLTGTRSLFTGRWMVVGKSPLTGGWGESNCGGRFSPAIKQCGYDGIFFTGASPSPVYLHIDSAGPRLIDASDLWGKDTAETEEILLARKPKGQKPAVACIGPAGEKRSLIAGICHDFGRFAARAGLGAVMGSKNLKAVSLAGSRPIGCADPETMKKISQRCAGYYQKATPMPGAKTLPFLGAFTSKFPLAFKLDGIIQVLVFKKWGTVGTYQMSVEWGDAPIKNWAGSNRDYPPRAYAGVDPERVLELEQRKYFCYACPLGCGGIGRFGLNGKEAHKPEFETLMGFGGMQLNNDLDTLLEIHNRLNQAGMDSISAGAAVAFALECYEKGILSREDTGGIELRWGDARASLALLEKMIAREGIGDLLADGVKRAVERLGARAADAAIHAGGQELAFHDSRLDPGFALHASVEPNPGRHTSGAQSYYEMYHLWTRCKDLPGAPLFYSKRSKYHSSPVMARKAAAVSCFTQLYNAAGLCFFGALLGADRLGFFEGLNAALGWNLAPEEYMQIGKRIQTLRQMFNLRQGIDPRSTRISPRALGLPPLGEGANRGRTIALDGMIRDYYTAMGWHPQSGVPLPETLAELDLDQMGEPPHAAHDHD